MLTSTPTITRLQGPGPRHYQVARVLLIVKSYRYRQ